MTPHLFARLLDVLGSDLEAWPDEQRRAAMALLAHSEVSRQRWKAARRLDELLALDRARSGDDPPVSAERLAAITESALRRIHARPERSVGWRWGFPRTVGAALAVTAIAGWVLGVLVGPELEPSNHESAPAIELLLGDPSAELEGLP